MNAGPQIEPAAWVDRYGDALYHFALSRVKNREIAEDLVQETFLAAVKAKDRFRGQSSEKTWLFGILKHKVIDHYRKKKAVIYEQDFGADTTGLEAFFNAKGAWQTMPEHWRLNPGKSQEVREFLDHFYQCLAELPQKTAEVFAYREIDGLSTKEICKLLDITASNCWVILYRARMLLRKCLELAGLSPPQKADNQ
jgi:RNA polymerase sigma-70 factor (ECF subfamily)